MSTLTLAAESLRRELPEGDPMRQVLVRLVARNDWPVLRTVLVTHEQTRLAVLETQLEAVRVRLRALEALPETGGEV